MEIMTTNSLINANFHEFCFANASRYEAIEEEGNYDNVLILLLIPFLFILYGIFRNREEVWDEVLKIFREEYINSQNFICTICLEKTTENYMLAKCFHGFCREVNICVFFFQFSTWEF